MATFANKAQFKTGYDQREIVVDVKSSSAVTFKVGEVVSISGSTISQISNTAANTVIAPAVGNYIIAQSDMTMDRRNYAVSEWEYDDTVKFTAGQTKKIAVFRINDVSDIVVNAYQKA